MLLIPSLKHKTRALPIQNIPDPEYFYMPLQAYGKPMKPLVAEGERVLQYTCIAASEGNLYSNLHAPCSGTVSGVVSFSGQEYLKIKNDFRYENSELPAPDLKTCSPAEIIAHLKNYGIAGSGGAMFPTYKKYETAEKIHTLIINAAECEPYLSADYVLINEHARELMLALKILQQCVAASKIVFGLERQNKALKEIILKASKEENIPVSVQLLPDTYPQGGELQLIRSITKLELPKGSIPAAHGIIVNNVGTLWAIYEACFEHKPFIARIITISGNACAHPGNYRVKIGTPVAHILEQSNNHWDAALQQLVLGGPMMGKIIKSPETPVNKGSGGLLIFRQAKTRDFNCIECGYCADVCPQHLMPMEFARAHYENNTAALSNFQLNDCIECGACAYTCPSNVPLMESIFEGKLKITSQA